MGLRDGLSRSGDERSSTSSNRSTSATVNVAHAVRLRVEKSFMRMRRRQITHKLIRSSATVTTRTKRLCFYATNRNAKNSLKQLTQQVRVLSSVLLSAEIRQLRSILRPQFRNRLSIIIIIIIIMYLFLSRWKVVTLQCLQILSSKPKSEEDNKIPANKEDGSNRYFTFSWRQILTCVVLYKYNKYTVQDIRTDGEDPATWSTAVNFNLSFGAHGGKHLGGDHKPQERNVAGRLTRHNVLPRLSLSALTSRLHALALPNRRCAPG